MANSLTWYTACDLALAATDSVLHQCQSYLYALHQVLTGAAYGANVGPLGAPVAGCRWTLAQCCDSATVKTDGTDLLTGYAKFVRAAAASPHSWAVYFDGTYYLTVDYVGANDYQATFVLGKTAPSGGTTTARPTATGEASKAAAQFMDSVSWASTAGRLNVTMTTAKDVWVTVAKSGTGKVAGWLAATTPTNLQATDLQGKVFGVGYNATNCLTQTSDATFEGGTSAQWLGRCPTSLAAYGTLSASYLNMTSGTVAAGISGVNSDGKLEPEPICLVYTGAGTSGGGKKGYLVDADWAPSTAATLTRFPAVGDVERVVFGNVALPFTAIPTL